MPGRAASRSRLIYGAGALLVLVATAVRPSLPALPPAQARGLSADSGPLLAVPGAVSAAVATAHDVGPADASAAIDVAVALPWQNQAALNSLLSDLYNPSSPRFHQFLTADQFDSQFAVSTDKRTAIST